MRVQLDIPLTLKEIALATEGCILGEDKNRIISALATDSREILGGELFFAIKGKNFDGEDFTEEARNKGAIPLTRFDKNGLWVKDTITALLALANFYKTKLKNLKHTVGITGSVGKTTTKEFLSVILAEEYKVHFSKGNLNNNIGLPLALLSAKKDSEILILEMGMNHRGEISKLSRCAEPDIGIITNIGTSHIGHLGSKENIAKAKLEIADGMKHDCLIIPFDEPLLQSVKNKHTFSSSDPRADIYIIYNEGKVLIKYQNRISETEFAFCAEHLVNCLCAAVAAAKKCGIKESSLKRGISNISSKNIRQNTFKLKDFYILSDYYNSSQESVKSALDYMSTLTEYPAKSAVLGDILELGDMSTAIHRNLGIECASHSLNKLFIFGEQGKYIKEGALLGGMAENSVFLNSDLSDPKTTAKEILLNHTPGEILLFKASNKINLGRIVDELKK